MKQAREEKIRKEIEKRVFEESRRRTDLAHNNADRKIEIDALSEMSELPPDEVARIADEVRVEFAGVEDTGGVPVVPIVIAVLVVLVIAGGIVYNSYTGHARRTALEAQIRSLTLYGNLDDAIEKGDISVAEYLLDQGAPLSIFTESKTHGFPGSVNSVLHSAAYFGQVKIVRLLLARGADVTLRNGSGWSPLDVAADREHDAIVKILAQAYADASPAGGAVRSLWARGIAFSSFAFIESARKGDENAVRLFIEGGMDIDAKGKLDRYDDFTALEAVARDGNIAMVKLLLSLARPDKKPALDRALGFAVSWKHIDIVRILLDAGANPNDEPFRYVLEDFSIAQLLLAYGADINKGSGDDDTPALIDVLSGRFGGSAKERKKIVKFLIDNGADVNRTGGGGRTAIEYARDWGDPEVIRWIVDAGGDE